MATQSPQIPFVQQPSAHPFPHQHQYPHGYTFPFGGHSYSSGPMNHSDPLGNPHIRIAVLEKELEHCRTGKAEAEITVQYLASLNTKGTANGTTGNIQAAKLKQQLAQAMKEKEALESKLENALAIITTILTAPKITSVLNPVSKSNKIETSPAPSLLVQNEDLIDLLGAPKGLDGSSTSGNDATLLDQSYDDLSEDEDEAQNPLNAKHLPVSELTDGEKEPYIHHFLPNVHGIPIRVDQVPTFAARGSIDPKSSTSLDQRSETSIEPETDVSYHEHATSSDGPVSSSTSFVTANTQISNAHASLAENVTNTEHEAQTLGVQRRNVAASATAFEDVEASGLAMHYKYNLWSSKDKKFPNPKSPQGQLLDRPSCQVCKLFFLGRQSEDDVKTGPMIEI